MSKVNKEKILKTAGTLFAQEGIRKFSIRILAKELKIAPSLIYYYFETEEDLLLSMFEYLNHQLGEKRKQLPQPLTAKAMLKQRIEFQIDHLTHIVSVLKYYLKFRDTFPKFKDGFLPDKSALHIEEVLDFGLQTGEFKTKDPLGDAKVMTHAINGYLLEFYPHTPSLKEKQRLVKQLYNFLIRALVK